MKFTKKQVKDIQPLNEHKKLKRAWLMLRLSSYFVITTFGIYGIVSFFSSYKLQTPIVFQSPVVKIKTDLKSPVSTRSASLIRQVNAAELTDEEYIRHKFGSHGDVAVAIAKAESGLRADAVNPNNSNGTIDIGCWQVNSIHLKKGSITIDELLDCKKATDWVYDNLYKYQGFAPWVAFNSGAYLAKM